MTVWIEYAIIENFILDGGLLYLALKTARQPIQKLRLFFAAALGTAFAVLFPLLELYGWYSFVIRYAFGAILCLTAVKGKAVKNYLFTTLFFYLYTFAYGGLLLGMVGLFNVNYQNGNYLLPQTPAQIVVALLPIFMVITLLIMVHTSSPYRMS